MPQADSVDHPARLPLVVAPENRDETTNKDARLINGYVEKTNGDEYWVYKRPGLVANTTLSGNGYGTFNWMGDAYAIFGSTLYKNGVAIVGTVDTTNGVYRFSSLLGVTRKMFLMNGVKAYTYDASNGLVMVTDVNYPAATVKGTAFLDGTMYVMSTNGTISGSDINDATTWPALNTIIAQIEPDSGVTLAKQLVYVLAMKQWTTEVFYDAANTSGSPLSAVQGARLNFGCASADSLQDIDNTLFWLSSNRSTGYQIVMLEQLKPTIISTKPIERLLTNTNTAQNFIASWQFRLDGHRFYVLTLVSQNLTLAYDLNERMWSQWTDTNGNYLPIVSATYKGNTNYLQHATNGKLYDIASTQYTDDGTVFAWDLYTPNFDGGVRHRKYLKRMDIIADQTPGAILSVRKSDDDYQSWSNYRTIDLGKERPNIIDCGTFRRRAHHFHHAAPTKLRIKAIELQMDIGTL
jgi:hypothetical protein